MASPRTLLFSAAVLLTSGFAATAADMYGGSMKDAPYMAPVASPSGWYLRGDGAWASYDAGDLGVEDLGLVNAPGVIDTFTGDTGSGWSIGGGVGKYFGNGFRGDLTLEYRTSTDVSGSAEASCCTLATETEFDGTVGLANLYYDFNRGGRITPYIGGGIGFAHLSTDGGILGCTAKPSCYSSFGDATYGGSSTTNFAAAAMAGVTVKLRGGEPAYMGGIKDGPVMVEGGRGLYLDIGYRFLHLGELESANAVQTNGNELTTGWDDLNAHEVRFGLRYDLH